MQIATWALVAICGFQAGYAVWGKEHDERRTLEDKLLPRIRISIIGNSVSEEIDKGFNTKRVQYVVKGTTNTPLVECQALLLKVDRLDGSLQITSEIMQEPLHSEWSTAAGSEKFGKITIPEGISQRANLFAIFKQGGPLIPIIPDHKEYLFEGISVPGKYLVSVAVSAEDARTAKEEFILEWTDYENVSLTMTRKS